MPGKSPVEPATCSTEYLYDGSWKGFFCCVFESVYQRELPIAIWPHSEAQPSLYLQKEIATEEEKFRRVLRSVPKKISPRAEELLHNVFLSCLPEKEMAMLRFLRLGYKEGSRTPWMFGHPDVEPLLAAEKHQMGEVHLLRGFIRFSDSGGKLVAAISPKNFVLPYLAEHFVGRFSQEDFLIYDKTHGAALIYEGGVQSLVPLSGLELDAADESEELYRGLWKCFYNTVSIEERENPRCRMGHMPKRYWENMLEVKDLL